MKKDTPGAPTRAIPDMPVKKSLPKPKKTLKPVKNNNIFETIVSQKKKKKRVK